MSLIFPAAFALNTFSMTCLLIVMGLIGQTEIAADIGIVQAAVLVVFSALSGNARSIALNPRSSITLQTLLASRLLLAIPCSLVAYVLCAGIANADTTIVLCFIARRIAEWVSEIHLSECELKQDRRTAFHFTISQFVLMGVALVSTSAGAAQSWLPALGLAAWALSPLAVSFGFTVRQWSQRHHISWGHWHDLAPHWGSTAMIAIGVYAFRSLICELVDKPAAGLLFTAFSLGGMVSSVYTAAIGPTLVLFEGGGSSRRITFVRYLFSTLVACLLITGVAIVYGSQFSSALPVLTGKSAFFLGAIGYSIIGGAIMLVAQRLRLHVIQNQGKDVFGPDALSMIAIIVSTPFWFHAFGPQILLGCFLWNSILVLLFYWSNIQCQWLEKRAPLLLKLIAGSVIAGLCLPLCIELPAINGWSSVTFSEITAGTIHLPITLSIVACYFGLAFLGSDENTGIGLSFISLTAIFLIMAVIFSTRNESQFAREKLIAAIHWLLPLPAIVLGQLYAQSRWRKIVSLPSVFFGFLIVFIPLHLAHVLISDTVDLGLTSVDQLRIAPDICVALFAFCLFTPTINSARRNKLILLAVLMGVYLGITGSAPAIAFYFVVVGISITWHLSRRGNFFRRSPSLALALFCFVPLAMGLSQSGIQIENPSFLPTFSAENSWEPFLIGDVGSATPSTASASSGYFWKTLTSFGMIPLVPMLCLAFWTLTQTWRFKRRMATSPEAAGLIAIAAYFVVLLNNQIPYGTGSQLVIFAFFFWGLLLTRITQLMNSQASQADADETILQHPLFQSPDDGEISIAS